MPHELLDHLMTIAGEAPASKEVEFIGADPIFPTAFRFGDMGAATIGAAAAQAARLWQMRGGRSQQIRIPVDAAAAAMSSRRYYKQEPIPGLPEPKVNWNKRGNAGNGTFATRDGRLIYFQREFEYHRDRMDAVIGCIDDRESMAAGVAKWDAFELEEAVARAGACAGVVRSPEEWRAHPQGQALARLPVFEVTKIGDSAPEPLSIGAARPLSGVRVMDLTRVLAGPTAAKCLAEHGADVLRISTSKLPDDPAQAIDTGHGKRGTDLDFTARDGKAALKDLLREADVFSQAFRPGALAGHGLAPEDLAKIRPGIIVSSLSCFGREGPWSDRRGFDSITQNVSGISAENGGGIETPRAAANPLDFGTGYIAAFAIMVALTRRAREGGSYLVRASLAQTGWWTQSIGRIEKSAYESRPANLPEERLPEITQTEDTPYGRLTHLRPVPLMSETPARWDLPSVPLGTHQPVWLPHT